MENVNKFVTSSLDSDLLESELASSIAAKPVPRPLNVPSYNCVSHISLGYRAPPVEARLRARHRLFSLAPSKPIVFTTPGPTRGTILLTSTPETTVSSTLVNAKRMLNLPKSYRNLATYRYTSTQRPFNWALQAYCSSYGLAQLPFRKQQCH